MYVFRVAMYDEAGKLQKRGDVATEDPLARDALERFVASQYKCATIEEVLAKIDKQALRLLSLTLVASTCADTIQFDDGKEDG